MESPGKLLHHLHRLKKSKRCAAGAFVVHGVALIVDPSAVVNEQMQDDGQPPDLVSIQVEGQPVGGLRLLATVLPFGNSQQVSFRWSFVSHRFFDAVIVVSTCNSHAISVD